MLTAHLDVLDRFQEASVLVAVDVHRAGAADASRQERRKVSVPSTSFLILMSASEDHRSAGIEIDARSYPAGDSRRCRIPAIDLEIAHALGAPGAEGLAGTDFSSLPER